MGFPPDTDMNLLFNSMTKTIESLKQFLDKWDHPCYTIQVIQQIQIYPTNPNVFFWS
jgi:hypothetical protein